MTTALQCIGSMATRGLLEELAREHSRRSGVAVSVEAVGGVEAARRVAAGEAFDVVVLASEAIDRLAMAGHLRADGKVDVAHSGVGVAVRAGAPRPDIATGDALRSAVREAASIGYSTGPSGVALLGLFKHWGIEAELQGRLVQAPPGVPVGALVARGDAALGFQQMSELIGVAGIDLLGPLPPERQITTIFSAAPGIGTMQPEAVRAWLAFMASEQSAETKRRHGMAPA